MNNVRHCIYVVVLLSARSATRGAPSGGVHLSHAADTSRNWARIIFFIADVPATGTQLLPSVLQKKRCIHARGHAVCLAS
jgi:hypothetical protein